MTAAGGTPKREQISEVAEALCAADSILSLLHYRHRNELGEQNQADVAEAVKKLTRLRPWYEAQMRRCPVESKEGFLCDRNGIHVEHEHLMPSGSLLRWYGVGQEQ